MAERPFPKVPEALLKALLEAFPQKPPSKKESYADLMFRAGQAEVISFLQRQAER